MRDFMSRVRQLYDLSKLPRSRSIEEARLLVEERERRTKFDTSWLEHLDEKPIREVFCADSSFISSPPNHLILAQAGKSPLSSTTPVSSC